MKNEEYPNPLQIWWWIMSGQAMTLWMDSLMQASMVPPAKRPRYTHPQMLTMAAQETVQRLDPE